MWYKSPFVRLPLALLGSLAVSSPALADELADRQEDIEFDTQMMKTRGVDPKLAEWFRYAPRFLPGESTVDLIVNGNARGRATLRFDSDGKLCADKKFQSKAALVSPPGFKEDTPCFDLKTAWPQTELNLNPGEQRVELVVPPQAVAAAETGPSHWNHGGFAGMLNYSAQYMGSAGSAVGVNFMQLDTEAGFNISDWIVRSRQTFSRFNGENQLRHQNVYAQRSFIGLKKVLQTGQISLSNSMFGTGQVLGFQMFPEMALPDNRDGPGLVDGIADSQSVVEVRQSGVRVYRTTVPAGPFRLQGFSLLNTRSDLIVTVTSGDGATRQFTVPASALQLNNTAVAPGLSFGVGKLDQQGSSEAPLVGTIASGWTLFPRATLNAGLLGSAPYRAGALGLDHQLFDATQLSLQTTLTQDNRHGSRGVSLSASLSHTLIERLGVNVNVSQQTSGYREMSDALQAGDQDTTGRGHNQIGGGVSWSEKSLGSLSLSWARSTTFGGDHTDYLRGGWSKQFGRTYLGASLSRSSGSTTTDAENRAFLNLNIPFSHGRSISSYVNSSGNGRHNRAGLRYSDRSGKDYGWSLSSERDFRYQRTSSTGSVDWATPISQLSGSLSQNSDHHTTWSARATGAVVAHDQGLTLSPHRVGDTFGIAKVGDEAGVRLETPAGPTWTDRRGYAVLASLSGYRRSAIQLDTRSLEKNIDIANAWQETEAARGSVNYVNFEVVRSRRVLVDVTDVQGNPLPYRASVFDSEGNFVTVVGNQGQLFIPDAANNMQLDVQTSGRTLCSIVLSLPEKAVQGELFETAIAQCR